MLLPVILAGGCGTRLWPLSRQLMPKQFHALTGEQTMLQSTLARLDGVTDRPPLLLCNEEHRFIAAEQLRGFHSGTATIVLEPMGRNTAPAIALAALHATAADDDPLLLVLAADHVIQNVSAFRESVAAAVTLARSGHLVTFGVSPTRPETGYGYIERGEAIGDAGFAIARFVEKPGRNAARQFIDEGCYYWNSGSFLCRASRYLEELAEHRPEVLDACREALATGSRDMDFVRVDRKAFAACPDISIDHAVMERTSNAAVVPLDAGWSDIGSWSALAEVLPRDTDRNVRNGDVIALDTHESFIHSDHRLVATVGVEDLVIVETRDAVLVAHKDRVQDIRNIVCVLDNLERTEHVNHRQVFRPWGCYDSVDHGARFQVKRITVNPGARLSLQMHHHRAEHWVVVRGTARVTNGEDEYLVSENESTYIPLGHVHALENPGHIPLELIEVQSGSYLGEDDIVRLKDWYGRMEPVPVEAGPGDLAAAETGQ